jgi:hypothetical protein
MVKVLRRDGTTGELSEDDDLSGEDVIPGFRCTEREILPRREPSEEARATPAGPNGSEPA